MIINEGSYRVNHVAVYCIVGISYHGGTNFCLIHVSVEYYKIETTKLCEP